MIDYELIGKRVKEIREFSGLSIRDLESISGVSKSCIFRIETGEANTTIHSLDLISNALGITVGWLIGEVNEPYSGIYCGRVCDIQRNQTKKGLKKYGVPLESNERLSPVERVQYLEEELIDGLMYCEHLKEILKEQEDDLK